MIAVRLAHLGSALDGDGVRSECAALRPHALPLHRALLSRDDRARACPWLYFVGHLRVDYLAVIIVGGSKLIWWATERMWGKFS